MPKKSAAARIYDQETKHGIKYKEPTVHRNEDLLNTTQLHLQ
jgi:hypothetical protein